MVLQTAEMKSWFKGLDDDAKEDVLASVLVLEVFGPSLGRPNVDTLKGTSYTNLKELRVQSKGRPFRVLFAFDPERNAILLIGGNKEGDKRFYEVMIPMAEKLYAKDIRELLNEKEKKISKKSKKKHK